MSKQTKPMPLMGVLSVGYHQYMIPLDDAHIIQKILSGPHVYKADEKYSSKADRKMMLLMDAEPPSVAVLSKATKIINMVDVPYEIRNAYDKEVLAPYRDGNSDIMMGIEEYITMLGDGN